MKLKILFGSVVVGLALLTAGIVSIHSPRVALGPQEAAAQFPCSTSANLGFQVPNVGNTTNWGTCLNYDLQKLDLILGGTSILPRSIGNPNITSASNYLTQNIGSTSITNFQMGYPGQSIRIFCGTGDTFTSIGTGTFLKLSSPWSCATSSSLSLTLIGTVWTETARWGGGGGGGGSSIFTQFQFGANSPITGNGNYVQFTSSAAFTISQSGSGTIGSPYVDTLAFASQSANSVLAAPNGSSGVPGFRALVGADLPAVNLAASGAGGVTGNLPVTNLNGGINASSSTVWCGNGTWCNGGGSVTSVGLSMPSWLSVANSPVTSTGTLTVTPATAQTSHQVIGTCGSATTFTPCALVAGDIPQLAYSSLSGLPQLPITIAPASHQWLTGYASSTGLFTQSQPAFTDISGTIASTQFGTPSANTFLAAPNGSAGNPTFRLVVAADIPTLNQSTTGNAATATALASVPTQCGSNNFATGIAASGNANCSQPSFSNLSGTITSAQFGSQTANFALIAPNGVAGNPTFRALVGADIPAINLAGTGNGGVTGSLPYSSLSGAPTLFYQTVQSAGTSQTQRGKLNLIAGTNITITPVDNSGAGSTDVTITASSSASTAWSALTASTNSNAGTFAATGNVWTFSGATSFTLPTAGGIFPGATSGTATVVAQAVAGTPTLTLPNATGTFAVGASAPLVLNTTTGNLTVSNATTGSTGVIQLAGDIGGTGVSVSVLNVHGVSYPGSPSTNTVPVVTGSNTVTYETVPNAALANITIGINGTANQITSSTATPALGGSTTLALANPLTFPGKTTHAASVVGAASLNIPSGVAPTSPVSGDLWNASGIAKFFDGTNTNSFTTIQAAPTTLHLAQFSGTSGLLNDSGIATSAVLTTSSIVTVPEGGTGLGTLTAHAPILGEGTSNVASAVPSANGQCFMSAPSSFATTDPSFQTCPTGFTNPMTTLGDTIYGGASGTATRLAGPTGPNGVAQILCDVPSAGAATAEQWCLQGVPVNQQVGTTYTFATTDRLSYLSATNASAQTYTLPASTGTGFSGNFSFVLQNLGAGTVSLTPTTPNNIDGGSSQAASTLLSKFAAFVYQDSQATPLWWTIKVPTFAAFPATSTNAALTFSTTTGFGTLTGIAQTTNGGLLTATSPVTISAAGVIACATCTTSAAAQTNNAVVIGGGGQTESTISVSTTVTNALFATAGAPAFRNIGTSDVTPNEWVAGGGTAQAQTATLAPAATALTDGLSFCWKPTAANTAAAPTMSVNGLTATSITKLGNTALVANDIVTTAQACVIYNSSGPRFELQNPQTATGGSGTVTSVALNINGGTSSGIFAVTGSPVTVSGTLNYNFTGNSGGVPYFSSSSVLSTSAALTANALVKGGGAGAAPSSGDIQDVSNLVNSASASTQSLTFAGGQDVSANSVLGSITIRGANQTGAGGATSSGGGVLITGGTNAATNAASQGGSIELLPGGSTGSTQGLQGLMSQLSVYIKGTVSTQWNLECESAAMTVADCAASPNNWIGVAELVNTNTTQVITDGQSPVNASAAVTLGHTVCAGSSVSKVTDSGGTTSCTNSQGTTVGTVMATSGTWTLPDGTSFTASTTLPLIQMNTAVNLPAAGSGTVTSVATTSPISGGTFTTSGTITCPTCVTSAAALTSNGVVIGGGSQASQTVAGIVTDGVSKLTLGVAGTSVGAVVYNNATSGSITLQPVTGALGSVTLSLPTGTATFTTSLTVPSWLTAAATSSAGVVAVTAATGQTSHQVIATCGAATSFAPCSLVAGDLPNIPMNQIISATGAIGTIANGNNPLTINCALTSGTTCLTLGETTAATTAGAVEEQVTTLTTTTAIALQITQGAAGPANANAPAVLNISAAAAGGAAGASNAGSVGAPISLLTGAGSAGGATTGIGGAGGGFTLILGAGGAAGGTATNNGGNGGPVSITTGAGGNGGTGAATAGSGGGFTVTLGAPGTNSATGTAGTVGQFNITGNAPASTANAAGVGSGTIFNVSGVAGGASSNAAGTAGVGSSIGLNGGIGGAGTGTNAVGGAGGALNFTTGNGGASAGTGLNANGGNLLITLGKAGIGGSGTAGVTGEFIVQGTTIASSSTTPGLSAGTLFLVSGLTGGANTTATGSGGAGSIVTLNAGAGGAASGATAGTGGAGGAVNLTAGNGGAGSGTGANANGGSIVLTPGAPGTGGSGTAGLAGVVSVAGTTAGFVGFTQGSANTTANTNIPANTIVEQAPASVTAYIISKPGAAPVNNNSAQLYSNASPGVGVWAKMPQIGMVTAQQATLTTLTNLTGLSFSVEASTKYVMKCTLYYQVSATTANLSIAVTGPASPTFVTYSLFDTDTATGIAESGVATAFATTLSGSGTSTATTNFPATVTMGLSNGANAGTVQVQAGAVGTGNSTIQTGSWCQLQ